MDQRRKKTKSHAWEYRQAGNIYRSSKKKGIYLDWLLISHSRASLFY